MNFDSFALKFFGGKVAFGRPPLGGVRVGEWFVESVMSEWFFKSGKWPPPRGVFKNDMLPVKSWLNICLTHEPNAGINTVPKMCALGLRFACIVFPPPKFGGVSGHVGDPELLMQP